MRKKGLKPKPEVGIQFGAGGSTSAEELEAQGHRDVGLAISQAQKFIDAGAYMIMIESEGITENVKTWRTDVVAKIINALGTEKVMLLAEQIPDVLPGISKVPQINLFVDHSQIVQLEAVRSGIWGKNNVSGHIVTYKGK